MEDHDALLDIFLSSTIIINLSYIMNFILLSAFLSFISSILADPIFCPGNRFKYISSYELGRQDELTKTFAELQPMVHVDNVTYKDEVFRTYTVFPLTMEFSYA